MNRQVLAPFKPRPPKETPKPDSLPKRYRPRNPFHSRLRRLVERELDRVQDMWERFERFLGPWKTRYQYAAERFLDCGVFAKGYASYRCGSCGQALKVPFSCKCRLCPSCVRKRMSLWSEWLVHEMLLDLPHRHWVFTLPVEVRKHYREKRWLLNKLSNTAARILMRQMTVRCQEPGAVPGIIAVVQTAGDRLTFNPHVHMIATTHCLGPSGRLYRVPYIPYVKLSRIWKAAMLALLKNTKCIEQKEADKLWKKYHNGFNLNGEIKDTAADSKASKRLAEYLARPAMAEHRVIHYNEEKDEVVFKARGPKNIVTGRRPPTRDRMCSTEFVARLLVQTPPKGQKLVNYYGFYSNKIRGMHKKTGFKIRGIAKRHRTKRFKLDWRSLLWRVYEVDPLKCPNCGEELDLLDFVLPPNSSILEQPP